MRARNTRTVSPLTAGELPGGTTAPCQQPSTEKLSEDDAFELGIEAYVYGYPLVLMDVTRQVATSAPNADEKERRASSSPVNQLRHRRSFPDATFTNVVSPNADTLYSIAWLDLCKEPMILGVPGMGKRYYVMQLLDAWTNVFASPGTRTTGSGKGEFAIVGPGWNSEIPGGVQEIRSPTNMVWLIGRTQTNGRDDYAAVHAIQDQYKLAPLSGRGEAYAPPVDVPVTKSVHAKPPFAQPVEQVANMGAAAFFAQLNALTRDNPPAAADAEVVQRFAAVGVGPGKAFDLKSLPPNVAKGLERSVPAARGKIVAEAEKPAAQLGQSVNGWSVMKNLGRYETNYLFRAAVARVALGANLAEDAVYPRATVDADGRPLTGANRYVIRFPEGQLPPVSAFWSVTAYNSKQFFVANAIDRYAIGDRDKLQFDDDGSLTLHVQFESPGRDQESNWLPAPNDEFNLFMRLYWPKKPALDGTWNPPAVERVR